MGVTSSAFLWRECPPQQKLNNCSQPPQFDKMYEKKSGQNRIVTAKRSRPTYVPQLVHYYTSVLGLL